MQENKWLQNKYEDQGQISSSNTKINPSNATTDALDLASSEQDLNHIFMIFSKWRSISAGPWFLTSRGSFYV